MNNFIIVGGQRCGTTWLYNALSLHPEIKMAMPVKPEPKYFLRDVCSLDEYMRSYFHNDENNFILGEKSTSYYEVVGVAEKIKKILPDSKILIITRNPIDRAISNYFFSFQNGLESRSIEEVFIDNLATPEVDVNISVNPFDYIKRGFYSKYIKNYIDIFGENKVKVLCFESLINNKNEFSELLSFLCVKKDFVLSDSNYHAVNPSLKKICDLNIIRNILCDYYREEVNEMSKFIDTSYWYDFYKS